MVNLKEKREAKNMSQQQLADEVGISRQAISNIEIGAAKPDVKHAMIIGRVLEFNWVLFYDDENWVKVHGKPNIEEIKKNNSGRR